MALPAIKREPEVVVENHVARLESDVAHIRSDVSEMKTDVRELRLDVRRIDEKISALSLGIEKSFSKLRLWAIMLYIALAAGVLAVVARAVKWI